MLFLTINCPDCYIFTPSAWLWRNTPEPPTTERESAVLSRRAGSLSSLAVRMAWPMCGIQIQVRFKTGLGEYFVLWLKLCSSLLCRWCSRSLPRALLSHCSPWRVFPPSWKHGCLLCLWTAPAYPHIPVRSQSAPAGGSQYNSSSYRFQDHHKYVWKPNISGHYRCFSPGSVCPNNKTGLENKVH